MVLHQARIDLGQHGTTAPIDLSLGAGDLALVNCTDADLGLVVADACSGLADLKDGSVLFLRWNWALAPADEANALRGRIGRLFRTEGAWLPYLSVLDNVLLRSVHHTRRTERELARDAADLARGFGLPGVPAAIPQDLDGGDLVRAALVRAFLSWPSLVILEQPARGLPRDVLAALVNTIRVARDRGGAVLWFTADPKLWQDTSLPVSARYRLAGGALSPITRTP
ncbi:MAG: organic solvent ABC transporter ATP-binding protein [Rhodospirillales bacterium]|nr:MAG: organic solvent ABC transporter ATP-binding protein [Rhodospirillales bacterium]